jgi:small subunit ribosomal protein S6
MPFYESVFIARQDVAANQVEALADQFSAIITGLNGKVTKREYWGLRNLTFRIKKNRKGHYMLLNIEAPHSAVAEMERNMRISEDVLRHMSVRVEALDPNPSPIMLRDRERDREGGRSGWDEQSAAEAAAGRGDRRDRRPRRFEGEGPRRFEGEGPRRFEGEGPRRFEGEGPPRGETSGPRRFDGDARRERDQKGNS